MTLLQNGSVWWFDDPFESCLKTCQEVASRRRWHQSTKRWSARIRRHIQRLCLAIAQRTPASEKPMCFTCTHFEDRSTTFSPLNAAWQARVHLQLLEKRRKHSVLISFGQGKHSFSQVLRLPTQLSTALTAFSASHPSHPKRRFVAKAVTCVNDVKLEVSLGPLAFPFKTTRCPHLDNEVTACRRLNTIHLIPESCKGKSKTIRVHWHLKPTVNKHHITTSSKCHCGTNQSSSNATKMLMMLECHPFCFSARIMPGGHTSSWMSLNHIRSRRLESLEWYPDIRFWRLLRRGCQARPRDHGLKSFRKPKSPDVFDHSNQCLGYVTEMKKVKTYGTGQRTPRINAA